MRASCCVSVLPPCTRAGSRTLRNTARAERDRIDAGMQEEAMILDGDERVLQIRRDRRDRHVVPLFIETKPAAAVGGVKPGVADAARELDRPSSSAWRTTPNGDRGDDDERVQQVLGPAEIGTQHIALISQRSCHIPCYACEVPLVLLLLLVPLIVIALMPVMLIQRYRAGKARRLARPWVATLNLAVMAFSAVFFLARRRSRRSGFRRRSPARRSAWRLGSLLGGLGLADHPVGGRRRARCTTRRIAGWS